MSKTNYVSTMKVGEEVIDFFLVASAQVKKTKKDKDYLALKLADKTGEIDAKLWDPPPGFDLTAVKPATFVKVKGQITEYNNELQMTVTQIRTAAENEISIEDFFRRSERDPEEMFNALLELLYLNLEPVGSDFTVATEPTMKLLELLLLKNKAQFIKAPAAKSVHHCFLGGLVEHVLSMANLAIKVCDHYNLRKDLVLAACVLHDIGKIRELTYDMGIGYSTEGTLVGHISIGMQMVSEACSEVPEIDWRLKTELLHMVASHHGLLEWGSPKIPMMREAIAFHLIDMMDSKMEICKEIVRNDRASGEFTGFSSHIGSVLYKGLDA